MTQIKDVVTKDSVGNLAQYVVEDSVQKNEFFKSGVVVTNNLIQEKASSGGSTVSLPFWRSIVGTAGNANLSNDNVADHATPNKVQSGLQTAAIAQLNVGFTSTDMAFSLCGNDPLQAVRDQLAEYWNNQLAIRLMATVKGVYNLDQKTGGSNDMTYPAKGVAAAPFSPTGVVRTGSTMGDNKKTLKMILVHPDVMEDMMIMDIIEYIKPSETSAVQLPTYKGLLLIEDEKAPKIGNEYVTILFGAGAFGAAGGLDKSPLSTERDESSCAGGGSEQLWSRVSSIVHPLGYKWLSVQAGESATIAELESEAAWERVCSDRRSAPMAFYRHTLPSAPKAKK